MRIVSPTPSASSVPRPTADLSDPDHFVPASVIPRWSGYGILSESRRLAAIVLGTFVDLTETLKFSKSRLSISSTNSPAAATSASTEFSRSSSWRCLGSEPELTPMRIGTPAAVAFSATSATLSRPPMLPGLSRMQCAPASIALSASVWLKWMSAITGIGDSLTTVFSASTSSSRGTATRTRSAPASATLWICSIVAARFAVSVLVIVWTATGAPPPIGTSLTHIWRLEAMPQGYLRGCAPPPAQVVDNQAGVHRGGPSADEATSEHPDRRHRGVMRTALRICGPCGGRPSRHEDSRGLHGCLTGHERRIRGASDDIRGPERRKRAGSGLLQLRRNPDRYVLLRVEPSEQREPEHDPRRDGRSRDTGWQGGGVRAGECRQPCERRRRRLLHVDRASRRIDCVSWGTFSTFSSIPPGCANTMPPSCTGTAGDRSRLRAWRFAARSRRTARRCSRMPTTPTTARRTSQAVAPKPAEQRRVRHRRRPALRRLAAVADPPEEVVGSAHGRTQSRPTRPSRRVPREEEGKRRPSRSRRQRRPHGRELRVPARQRRVPPCTSPSELLEAQEGQARVRGARDRRRRKRRLDAGDAELDGQEEEKEEVARTAARFAIMASIGRRRLVRRENGRTQQDGSDRRWRRRWRSRAWARWPPRREPRLPLHDASVRSLGWGPRSPSSSCRCTRRARPSCDGHTIPTYDNAATRSARRSSSPSGQHRANGENQRTILSVTSQRCTTPTSPTAARRASAITERGAPSASTRSTA